MAPANVATAAMERRAMVGGERDMDDFMVEDKEASL